MNADDENLLDAWLDGRLDTAGRTALRNRLQQDPALAVELARAARFEADLGALHQRPESARMPALPGPANRGRRRLSHRSRRQARKRGPLLAAGLGAGLLAALMGGVLWWSAPSAVEAATPRPLLSDQGLSTEWIPGVAIDLAAGASVSVGSDGWPVVERGRVILRVDPAGGHSIGLRDDRIRAAVQGTTFTLDRGLSASVLSVSKGLVAVESGSLRMERSAGSWLWSGRRLLAGRGPVPSPSAQLFPAEIPASPVEPFVNWAADGLTIDCSGPPGDGNYEHFRGVELATVGARWALHAAVELPVEGLAQAALRCTDDEGTVLWRLTVTRELVAVATDWPDYVVFGHASWPEAGANQRWWLRYDRGRVLVGTGDTTLVDARLPADRQSGRRIRLDAQRHGTDQGEQVIRYRDVLLD